MLLVQKSYWPHHDQQTFRLVFYTSNKMLFFLAWMLLYNQYLSSAPQSVGYFVSVCRKRPLSVCSLQLACMFSFPVDISGRPLNLFCIVFTLYCEHRLKSWEMTKSMNLPIKQKLAELNDCYHYWKSVVWCVESLGSVDAKSILLTKCFEFLWHWCFIKMWSLNFSVKNNTVILLTNSFPVYDHVVLYKLSCKIIC